VARPAKQEANDPGKRERILSAARKLIAQHGFEATSTKAIAAEAGVPSGLVFYYFETKDDLIEALFQESSGFVEDLVRKAEDQSQTIEVFLRALYDAFIGYRYQSQIVVAAIASKHPIGQKAAAQRRHNIELIARYLRSQASGKTSVDTKVLAQVITSSMLAAMLLEAPKEVGAFVRGLASVVKCGLASPK
jgi:AcrR family transcriptional regulator